MWGRRHIQSLREAISSWSLREGGTAITEYALMLGGIAILVIASLLFLGGSVGSANEGFGGYVSSPLERADNAIEPHECKVGGWMDLSRSDGTGFINQGDCMQYSNTGQ